MLAPDDRVTLREQLRPDPGTRLDYAVGTTFTLDLNAAVMIPLAFAAQAMRSSADPIAVLDAIRRAADRIDVFCQVGHIKVPKTPNDLAAFLEPMLHEVAAPSRGFLFHPKVWVARYLDEDDNPTFRLLCGSRNLTSDMSWDTLVRLDGNITSRRPKAQSRPLVDFISALPTMAVRPLSADRLTKISALASDVSLVEWDMPAGVGNVTTTFHSLGLRPIRGVPPIVEAMRGRRHLIVSPFVDDETITRLVGTSDQVTLVSRAEALERLKPATTEQLDTRVLSSLAALEQREDVEEDPSAPSLGLLGGLHAKFYVVEAARQATLFIGSANATTAGLFGRNVEFMLEFRGGPKGLGVDRFLDDKSSFADLLEEYRPTGGTEAADDETLGRTIEAYLRRIASEPLTATAFQDRDSWSLTVSSVEPIEPAPTGVTASVSLLSVTHEQRPIGAGPMSAEWHALAISEITPFIVYRATGRSGGVAVERATVVRAHLVNDPPSRFDEIIAKQFRTTADFLRFIALLLGLGESVGVSGDGASGGSWNLSPQQSGLFEMIVRAVADRPDAIEDLDRLVSRLQETERGQQVLPPGFSALWNVILKAHHRAAVKS